MAVPYIAACVDVSRTVFQDRSLKLRNMSFAQKAITKIV